MKQYDSIIQDLQSYLQEKPSANLRDRIIKSAEQGVTLPHARRRISVYKMLLVVFVFALAASTVVVVADVRLGWRERADQVLQETRAMDSGYITDFYPLVFYFSEELRDQQRRVAEITIWEDGHYSEAQKQHFTDALGLNLNRETDAIDMFLYGAFSNGSVVTIRFDNTPFHSWLLDEGTPVLISSRSATFSYLTVPFDTSVPIRARHNIEILQGELAGRTAWIPNFLLKPSSYTPADFNYDPNHNLLEIFHPERNISFTMEKTLWGSAELQDNFLPVEEIAIIVADTIYSRFNFCVDGMSGYLAFSVWSDENGEARGGWSAAILCEELTAHSMANELFHMNVDPVTGTVRYLSKNTPQIPFAG
jgi:hypothetical protein